MIITPSLAIILASPHHTTPLQLLYTQTHNTETTAPKQSLSQQIHTHRNYRLDPYYKHRITANHSQMRGDQHSTTLAPQGSRSIEMVNFCFGKIACECVCEERS